MTIALDEFAQELQRPIPEPERLALAIAHIAYPQLETEYYLHELDQLAKIMEKRLAVNEESKHQAHRFLRIFCQELGFTGDREHYYHPDNSYLNVVLERRRGLPITLCLICVAIARRIHLPIEGIGFPGHFMARFQDEQGSWLLDPFHGEVIAPDEAAAYLGRIFGIQPTLSAENYRAITPEAWAQRILFNLRNTYLGNRDTLMTIQVLNYLLVLMPRHPALWRERGLLHHQNQIWLDAIYDLRRSYLLFGQYSLVLGNDEQRNALIASLGAEEKRVVQVYQQAIQQIIKLN